MQSADTVIVGAGIAGLATAYHLARRGARRVLVLEREDAPGLHSSAKSAAILRTAVPEAAVAELTRRSARALREPPADLPGAGDGPFVDASGLILLAGAAGAPALERMIAGSGAAGDARSLAAADLRALAPEIRVDHGAGGRAWLFPAEGRIAFERLLPALAAGARAAGAEVRTGAGVAAVELAGGRVVGVRLADGVRVGAERVVLAAGAWAGALGAAAGSAVRLEPTRRHLAVAFLPAPSRADAPIVWDLDGGVYLRPERGGWMVCVCDQSPAPDPDRLEPEPEVVAALHAAAARYLGTDPARADVWCGLRTMTADDEFAIGPDPDVTGLFWVAGLGGAGMGAGWAAGDLAAGMLTGERDPLDVALAPARLAARGLH